MPTFIALCAKGLENFVIEDIKEKIRIAKVQAAEGVIFFDYEGDYSLLSEIKTVDDILILIKKFSGIKRYKTSLRNIKHQSAKANLKKELEIIKTFRNIAETPVFTVKASYEGRRDYTAAEIENSVSEGIISHYGWKNDEKGELYLNAILSNEFSVLGLSLENLPLHVKNKLKTVSGSLKRSVASSLLKLAGLKKHETILDPMCGSGIVAVEASLQGAVAIAGDIDESRLKIAYENNSIKKTNVEFHEWDARKTGLENETIDKIICNLPFDKQVKLDYDNAKFFIEFIAEMIRISKKNAVFVFLTAHGDIIRQILDNKNLKLTNSIKIINSGLESEILVIEKNS